MRETGPFKVMKIQEFQKQMGADMRKQKTWTFPEMVRYTLYLHTFLQRNQEKGKARWSRREYEDMAQMVRSRNSNQCRIFHAKMTQIHHDLVDIFNFFRCNIKEYNSIHDKFIGKPIKTQKSEEAPPLIKIPEEQSERIDPESGFVEYPLDEFRYIKENIEQDFPILGPPDEEEKLQRGRHDWFQEFDDYLSGLHGCWLDDI